MFRVICRLILRLLPFVYGYLIWWQSSHFHPDSIYSLSGKLSLPVIKAIGAVLELGHLFEFGLLYLFLVVAFLSFGRLNRRQVMLALVLSILYGLADEIHQSFVPFRSFSLIDLMKDAAGVLVIRFIIHRSYFKSRSSLGSWLRKITKFLAEKSGASM